MNRRYLASILGAALLGCVITPVALAQAPYPSKPIRLVVPFPAGGLTDVVARMTAERLSKQLGQPIVVENIPGNNGSLASEQVARAKPDGYTLVVTSPGTHAINHLVNRTVKYDPRTDFVYIGMISRTLNVVVGSTSLPKPTLQGVIEQSKEKPRSLSFALTGFGSSGHMAMELFKQATGTDYTSVPYKGDAPAVTDLIGGHVDLLIVNASIAAPYVASGKARALVVLSKQRHPLLPNTPSTTELGMPEVSADSWATLAGPAGLSPEVVSQLSQALAKVHEQKEFSEQLIARGIIPAPGTPADTAAFINGEVSKWSRLVEQRNLRATD